MKRIKKLCLSAVFLSLGLALPFLTMQIKEIGDSLLPMHIPVLLCGLLCGPLYGMSVGFILPILRGLIFTMPIIYPNGICMAFELATYGLVIGLLYSLFEKKSLTSVYLSLIVSQILGRIVLAAAKFITMSFGGKAFVFNVFLTQSVLDALPGIALQLILIPTLMFIIKRTYSAK